MINYDADPLVVGIGIEYLCESNRVILENTTIIAAEQTCFACKRKETIISDKLISTKLVSDEMAEKEKFEILPWVLTAHCTVIHNPSDQIPP